MIKYLGSKRVLLPQILSAVSSLFSEGEKGTVLDLFSGTSRVGHALKNDGYRVIANDHNAYAMTLARCYVQADDDLLPAARQLIAELNALPGSPGYMTDTYCRKSRYFHPKNGERIDAIREAIARKGLEPELEAVLLVSLMEASDRVDSTTGVQMAYLKSYAYRATRELHMRLPALLPQPAKGKCEAFGLDAVDALARVEADVTYIDPPYNQHSYLGNYHVWETLVRWDKPDIYGVACKRVDVRSRQSRFNRRSEFNDAFVNLLSSVTSRGMVISLSNEGYLSPDVMARMILETWGPNTHVERIDVDYPRYVGARIGIYNLKGKKVGKVSHLRNKEHLFVARRDVAEMENIQAAPVDMVQLKSTKVEISQVEIAKAV